ncbi:MAG: 6-bladed beta-propeller [Cyclobacteriaceae bacterium]
MRFIIKGILLLSILIQGCSKKDSESEVYHLERNNLIDISPFIQEVSIKNRLGKVVLLEITKSYLVICDLMSIDKGIHLYDLRTFKYVNSVAKIGRGPNEITRIGEVSYNRKTNELWVPDMAKRIVFKFPLDSLLYEENIDPIKGFQIYDSLALLGHFDFVNDSIIIGNAMKVNSSNNIYVNLVKFNIKSNHISEFGYEHPEAIEKRSLSSSRFSLKNDIIVKGYLRCDLLSILDEKGNLKVNIYGKNWFNTNKKRSFYEKISFYDNFILGSYNGDVEIVYDKFKRPQVNPPSKLLVYSLNGKYKFTLFTKYKFSNFTIDEVNKRIYFVFEDANCHIGYVDLNKVQL